MDNIICGIVYDPQAIKHLSCISPLGNLFDSQQPWQQAVPCIGVVIES